MSEIKPECLLFLSWQSDRKDCRNFVDYVVEGLSSKIPAFVTVIIDRDTVNVPGSPDIGDTIFEKIDRCDLFIADITLINPKESGYRRTPNPNVMIELGYAIKTLGWERILLIQCKDYGDIEDLPFDINHRRICNFTLGIGLEEPKKQVQKKQESQRNVICNISKTIEILLEKKLLFGGKKGNVPKFEITWQGNNGTMMNLCFIIKNVSSVLVSNLQSQDLTVIFRDGTVKKIQYNPEYEKISLGTGEKTLVHLKNQILGAGPGYNNAAWIDFDLLWQFSCEDENNNVFWYEVKKHIESVDNTNALHTGLWIARYIG